MDTEKVDADPEMALSRISSLVIDGSVLEGGGQLLRNAVALSTLLSKPIAVNNIRQGRKPPGLKRQHASGVELASEICSAKTVGIRLRSTAIEYSPGALRVPGKWEANPGTAGSTALILQVALPTLIYSTQEAPKPSCLTLHGGTNALGAPPIDYIIKVLFPFLHRLGLQPQLTIHKRGYWPNGGGIIEFALPPIEGPLKAVRLMERGELVSIQGRAYAANLPAILSRKMRESATEYLVQKGIDKKLIDIQAVREVDQVSGHGSGIVLWAETTEGCVLGASALGKNHVPSESVGKEAAEALWRNLEHEACVDEHLQDQMIIFLALAKGQSVVKTGPLTLHTKTAIWVAEQLSDAKFEIEEDASKHTTIIRCEGIGITAAQIKQREPNFVGPTVSKSPGPSIFFRPEYHQPPPPPPLLPGEELS